VFAPSTAESQEGPQSCIMVNTHLIAEETRCASHMVRFRANFPASRPTVVTPCYTSAYTVTVCSRTGYTCIRGATIWALRHNHECLRNTALR
jgi:hypothetical protein